MNGTENNESIPPEPPDRHRPAHPTPVRRHNTPVILHVTVCTSERRDILATAEIHEALRSAWNSAQAWKVGYYVIMPDHVHFFCAPGAYSPPTVRAWVKYWKRLATQTAPVLHKKWLSDCWDTQMRSQEHYRRKLDYVVCNPVRKGLAAEPDEWPYQGKINTLGWI